MMLPPENPQMFDALVQIIGRPELLSDDRFCTPPARAKNAAALTEIIEGWARQHDKREVMKAFAGRGIPCGSVFDTAEVLDEHLRERGTIVDLEHPTRGKFSTIISPLRLSARPASCRAPLYGEHTEDVLQNLAGYSAEEVAALRGQGRELAKSRAFLAPSAQAARSPRISCHPRRGPPGSVSLRSQTAGPALAVPREVRHFAWPMIDGGGSGSAIDPARRTARRTRASPRPALPGRPGTSGASTDCPEAPRWAAPAPDQRGNGPDGPLRRWMIVETHGRERLPAATRLEGDLDAGGQDSGMPVTGALDSAGAGQQAHARSSPGSDAAISSGIPSERRSVTASAPSCRRRARGWPSREVRRAPHRRSSDPRHGEGIADARRAPTGSATRRRRGSGRSRAGLVRSSRRPVQRGRRARWIDADQQSVTGTGAHLDDGIASERRRHRQASPLALHRVGAPVQLDAIGSLDRHGALCGSEERRAQHLDARSKLGLQRMWVGRQRRAGAAGRRRARSPPAPARRPPTTSDETRASIRHAHDASLDYS